MKEKTYRLLDANINRSLEGLRVIEDLCRFILDDSKLTARLKKIRHTIKSFSRSIEGKEGLIKARNIKGDVGKKTIRSESKRRNVSDIFRANVKRLEESTRVLEEFSKLIDVKYSAKLKDVRYKIYDLEKVIAKRLEKLQKDEK